MSNEEHVHVTATETDELRRLFHRAMKALTPNDLRPSSPCPDSETMVLYVTGATPQNLKKRINTHLAFCDTCWDDYVALAGPETIVELIRLEGGEEKVSLPAAIRETKEKWSQVVARAKDFVIDLGRSYSPGTLIGAIRILAAGPALAVRGAPSPAEPSVVIEVPVGDNVYGIALSWQTDGLSFDVAGYKTTELMQVGIVLSSTDGEEILSVETDTHGNVRFVAPDEELSRDRIIVMLILEEEVWEAFSLDLPKTESALAQP